LFLAILCRPPTKAELDAGLNALNAPEEEYVRLVKEYERRVAALEAYEKQMPARQPEWEKRLKTSSPWTVLEVADAASSGGASLSRQGDGSLLVSGPNNGPETYTMTATTKLKNITGIRLEVLPDPSLPGQGPGRAKNGNFVLNEFQVSAGPQGDEAKPKPVPLQNPAATFSQQGYAVAGAIDNNPATGWAVSPQFGRRHVAVFEAKRPINFPNGTALTFTLEQHFAGKDHNIGKFRLSVTTSKAPLSLEGPPEPVAKILAVEPDKRTQQQKDELLRFYRSQDAELARLQAAAAEAPPPNDPRLIGAQDLMWALLNSKAFLFNY
jgi:hypothetical protein